MENGENPRKRKAKRRGFNQKIKRLAKSNNKNIDDDTYQYVLESLRLYEGGFDDDEMKTTFASNVLKELDDKVLDVCVNKAGSRLIENLIPHLSDESMENLLVKCGDEIRHICYDLPASFVIEALLTECFRRREKIACHKFIVKVTKFLLNNIEDYIEDRFGNQIMRTGLRTLTGFTKEDEQISTDIPDDFKEIITDYGDRLIKWPQLKDFCNDNLHAFFLADLIRFLSYCSKKLTSDYIKKLKRECFLIEDESKLPEFYFSSTHLIVFEACVQACSEEKFPKFFSKYIQNYLVDLASKPATVNLVVKVLAKCNNDEQLGLLMNALDEKYADIIEAGNIKVLDNLATTCLRLGTRQGEFINNILKAFNCFLPNERQNKIIMCLCTMQRFEDYVQSELEENPRFNYYGTHIVQTMLAFKKPIKIVQCMLNMEQKEVMSICCNGSGSFIIDSYFKSESIGEKNREKFINNLKGRYTDLVSKKFGSRSFEAIWSRANLILKAIIMGELAKNAQAWQSSPCGKIIGFKTQFGLYKTDIEKWKNEFRSKGKTKNLLQDVTN